MNISTKASVLVVGNDASVQRIFSARDWKVIVDSPKEKLLPNLVCFTGGSDIDPSYYGEKREFRTHPMPRRDAYEVQVWEKYKMFPKVGICRGGQLLNVLSGGALWQHVDNHTSSHKMYDLLFTKKKINVTSCHHQMMIPPKKSHVLGIAVGIATEYFSGSNRTKDDNYDIEEVWIPGTKSLCVQYHPEYTLKSTDETQVLRDHFFKLIDWAFDLPL